MDDCGQDAALRDCYDSLNHNGLCKREKWERGEDRSRISRAGQNRKTDRCRAENPNDYFAMDRNDDLYTTRIRTASGRRVYILLLLLLL